MTTAVDVDTIAQLRTSLIRISRRIENEKGRFTFVFLAAPWKKTLRRSSSISNTTSRAEQKF